MGKTKSSRMIDADELIQSIEENGLLGSAYSDTERTQDIINKIERRAKRAREMRPVVHAHWCYFPLHGRYICTSCGHIAFSNTLKFCPGCGADMRGNENTGFWKNIEVVTARTAARCSDVLLRSAECSECGGIATQEVCDEAEGLLPYCPNCGAAVGYE